MSVEHNALLLNKYMFSLGLIDRWGSELVLLQRAVDRYLGPVSRWLSMVLNIGRTSPYSKVHVSSSLGYEMTKDSELPTVNFRGSASYYAYTSLYFSMWCGSYSISITASFSRLLRLNIEHPLLYPSAQATILIIHEMRELFPYDIHSHHLTPKKLSCRLTELPDESAFSRYIRSWPFTSRKRYLYS